MTDNDLGNELEKLVASYYTSRGYEVERPGRKVIWITDAKTGRRRPISKRNDFFGLFDIIAIRGHKQVRFDQVTTAKASGTKLTDIKAFIKKGGYNWDLYKFRYWQWVGGRKMQWDKKKKPPVKVRKGQLFKVKTLRLVPGEVLVEKKIVLEEDMEVKA